MGNRCNKDNAVINKPLHAETSANRNLQITTKLEALQANVRVNYPARYHCANYKCFY
jgi:phenylalanyl-tRNA synthetase beta subunit